MPRVRKADLTMRRMSRAMRRLPAAMARAPRTQEEVMVMVVQESSITFHILYMKGRKSNHKIIGEYLEHATGNGKRVCGLIFKLFLELQIFLVVLF
jgi:hypothetical protein